MTNNMENKKSKKTSFYAALIKWADITSLHGISYINNSKSILSKLIWTGILIVFFCFAIYILSLSFSTFFSFAVDTSIERVRKNEITFPSVTFCNLLYLNPKSKELSSELRHKLLNFTSETYIK